MNRLQRLSPYIVNLSTSSVSDYLFQITTKNKGIIQYGINQDRFTANSLGSHLLLTIED
ncbi:hypothetical protein HMPREF9374_2196 [Desmospora sp. 8437]|nr:hypothetical protein HMPREF9374_2196 [Desmospora sp. 8437]